MKSKGLSPNKVTFGVRKKGRYKKTKSPKEKNTKKYNRQGR